MVCGGVWPTLRADWSSALLLGEHTDMASPWRPSYSAGPPRNSDVTTATWGPAMLQTALSDLGSAPLGLSADLKAAGRPLGRQGTCQGPHGVRRSKWYQHRQVRTTDGPYTLPSMNPLGCRLTPRASGHLKLTGLHFCHLESSPVIKPSRRSLAHP